MDFAIIIFFAAAALWTSQTFAPPKKKEEKKTPEQELTEAIGKYLSKGNANGVEFNLKIHPGESSKTQVKP